MLLACAAVVTGLLLLTFGADRFVTGAAATARNLGVTPFLIGLTVAAVATSLPEVLVGSIAALQGRLEIAVGNALGSNIANIALVLGVSAVVVPISVHSTAVHREYLFMIVAVILAGAVLLNGALSRLDGLFLLAALVVILAAIVRLARQLRAGDDPLVAESDSAYRISLTPLRAGTYLAVGLALMLLGAEWLVYGAVTLALAFGISDLVIGLTIIAVGTSLPELAAAILCVLKREADIAIGNIIGSNMFNMLFVLGVPALLQPGRFETNAIARDYPVMLGLSLLMGFMLFMRQRGRIGRNEGLLLLLCFCGYQGWLFFAGSPAPSHSPLL